MDSKPRMPGHGSRPARRAASRLSRISALTLRRTPCSEERSAPRLRGRCAGGGGVTRRGGTREPRYAATRARPSRSPASGPADAATGGARKFRGTGGVAVRVIPSGRLAVLLGLLFGLAGSSTSAVTVALPELARDLDVTPSTAAWMVSGYTVALAVATATHGRLADMVGIRLPLCLGVTAMARRCRRGRAVAVVPGADGRARAAGGGGRRRPGPRDGPDRRPGRGRRAGGGAGPHRRGRRHPQLPGPARGRGAGGRRRLAVGRRAAGRGCARPAAAVARGAVGRQRRADRPARGDIRRRWPRPAWCC